MSTRKAIHTRRIACTGYERDDGLWDIECELTDVRGLPLQLQKGILAPGEPLHAMRLVMTVDDAMVIKSFETRTEAAPTVVCPEINRAYDALAGLVIGPGFLAQVRKLFAGVKGCTHLTEMIGPMATTAVQTQWAVRNHRDAQNGTDEAWQAKRPWILDSCHAYRQNGEIVKVEWPQYYKNESEHRDADHGVAGRGLK